MIYKLDKFIKKKNINKIINLKFKKNKHNFIGKIIKIRNNKKNSNITISKCILGRSVFLNIKFYSPNLISYKITS
ncbi:hypothetical protein [Candidatus Vidania fulgoroideorum]